MRFALLALFFVGTFAQANDSRDLPATVVVRTNQQTGQVEVLHMNRELRGEAQSQAEVLNHESEFSKVSASPAPEATELDQASSSSSWYFYFYNSHYYNPTFYYNGFNYTYQPYYYFNYAPYAYTFYRWY
jgi:hypothetical protein